MSPFPMRMSFHNLKIQTAIIGDGQNNCPCSLCRSSIGKGRLNKNKQHSLRSICLDLSTYFIIARDLNIYFVMKYIKTLVLVPVHFSV